MLVCVYKMGHLNVGHSNVFVIHGRTKKKKKHFREDVHDFGKEREKIVLEIGFFFP